MMSRERTRGESEWEWESKMRKQKLPWGAINYSSCSFVSFALDLPFARGIKEQLGGGLIAQFCQLQMGESEKRGTAAADLGSSLPPHLLNSGGDCGAGLRSSLALPLMQNACLPGNKGMSM